MAEFIFKSFDKMTSEDYKLIGFKSGLEVHQQVLTEKKLFCRCPAGLYNKSYDAELLRHMRPTLSELGEYDGTALMEFKTKKDIIYRINHDSVCTYEMDDTPPFMMNEEAFNIAIGIGKLFNATIVDELHIARKQYLDGSIPTGFQRTAIFCVNGKIPYGKRNVGVIQISIEEDSCREVSDQGHKRVLVTDRLGMPLIEIVTDPDMKTPQEVADVCELIRRATRSTGMVRTGHGASRQDVNVSVKGGTRIEIKGVSSIKDIPILTYHEAMRQWNLLRLKEVLKKHNITSKTLKFTHFDITNELKKTEYAPIKSALQKNGMAGCVMVKGFKNFLQWETQTGTKFSKEISDRLKVIACLTSLPNIICSGDSDKTITPKIWKSIRLLIGAKKNDAIVIVWGPKKDVATGMDEIEIRIREATIGIPSETRQALDDGTVGFERILPGAARMYPDTDLPPETITSKRIKECIAKIPVNYWDREKKYLRFGIPKDTVIPLTISKYSPLFEHLVEEQDIDPVLASVVLIHFPKRLKKRGVNSNLINEETFTKIFKAFLSGKLVKEGIYYALLNCIKTGKFSRSALPKPCSAKELNDVIIKGRKQLKKVKLHHPKNELKALMGIVMTKLRGRVNGAVVAEMIKLNTTQKKNHRNVITRKFEKKLT